MRMLETLAREAREKDLPVYSMAEWMDGKTEQQVIHPANDCNDLYSVSKNFTATAIGILYDRGMISLETSVYDLFHEQYPHCCGEQWKQVTVAHVLEQRVGIGDGFLDIDTEDIYQYPTTDFLEMVFSAPFRTRPGEEMVYSDSNYYLAARIAEQAAGEGLLSFLTRELFLPLKFQGWAWATCPMGHPMGATGLFIRVEDMVRFGQLYLQRGCWEGKQLLSEKWVDMATESRVHLPNGKDHYGFSFWRCGEGDAYHCAGMNGQSIYISPKAGRVVAWQSHDPKGLSGQLLQQLYQKDR